MNEAGNKTSFRAEAVPTWIRGDGKETERPSADWLPRLNGYRPAFIYFVTDGEYIKIGVSASPENRLKDLQGPNARELKRLAVMRGSEELEKTIHVMFAHLHVRGEWFKDRTGEIGRYIKNISPAKLEPDPPVPEPIPLPNPPNPPKQYSFPLTPKRFKKWLGRRGELSPELSDLADKALGRIDLLALNRTNVDFDEIKKLAWPAIDEFADALKKRA